MKTFGKILLTLLILGGLGYGGWFAYQRYFADAPKEGTVYVQSVAAITGVGPAGRRNRYAGVVEAKNVIELDPDAELTVKECFVSSGDKVKKDDPLFCYDVDSMQINYDQLLLDIQGLENGIKTGREKVENLKKQLQRAKQNKKYDIEMDIQTEELEIRKKEYELTGKRKQAEDMKHALENSVVFSPVDGTVRSVRTPDGENMDYDGSSDKAYITIVAGNDYCVKGTVSEQTIHTLQEGMEVRILRRVVRDVEQRGRSLDSVVQQYLTTVKPMHEMFVEPSKKNADIIIPVGGYNEVALDMVIQRVRAHLESEE